MAEAILEKAVCEKCGVDVRENTSFCYNCGNPVKSPEPEPVLETKPEAKEEDAASKAALEDLAERFRMEDAPGEKLAKAAAERRKARVAQRKPKVDVWEPTDESSSVLLLVLSLIITGIAAAVVFLMVFWK